MSIQESVKELLKIHERIKKSSKAMKNDRATYRELKEKVNNFMIDQELESIEASGLELVSRKRPPPSSCTRKFMVEHLTEFAKLNNDLSSEAVTAAVEYLFSKKPKPKKTHTLGIRKARKKKKVKKNPVDEPSTIPEHVEGDDLDMPSMPPAEEEGKLAQL